MVRTGAWRASLAALSIVFAANAAVAADDSGVHAFLSNLFGEAGRGASAPAAPVSVPAAQAEPTLRLSGTRRLARLHTVTIHRRKPVVVVADATPTPAPPSKPGRISIFEDTTLRPGDAVMMEDGVKIFAGSRSWPYAKTDFVSLAKARDLSRDSTKVLTALNDLPRT